MKTRLRRFLTKYGFRLDWSHARIALELSKVMGDRRYRRYSDLSNDPIGSSEFPRSKKEAVLIASLQGKLYVEVYAAITHAVVKLVRPGTRIIDLGCGSGAFTAWLAKQFPESTVLGVDRLAAIVKSARPATKCNYGLVVWDYCTESPPDPVPFEILVCSLGSEFTSLDGAYCLDLRGFRESEGFAALRDYGARLGSQWALVATHNAALVTVLRISGPEIFLAFCSGMAASGWQLCCDDSTTVASGDQKCPLLSFRRTEGSTLGFEKALSWWGDNYPSTSMADEFDGQHAVVRFLQMCESGSGRPTEVITTENAPPVRIELGEADESVYVLLRTAEGHTAFKQWFDDVDATEIREWVSTKTGLEG